jgi:YVTN family beta-propeller protein
VKRLEVFALALVLVAAACGGATAAKKKPRPKPNPGPAVRSAFRTGSGACGEVEGFGSMWISNYGDGTLSRVDPATNKVLATISVAGAGWTAASADAIWVTAGSGVTRIDPATDTVTGSVDLKTTALGDPAVIGGMLWVPKIRENRIVVIDPATNAVAQTVKTGTGPFVVTEINGEAWVPSWQGRDIWRFRP